MRKGNRKTCCFLASNKQEEFFFACCLNTCWFASCLCNSCRLFEQRPEGKKSVFFLLLKYVKLEQLEIIDRFFFITGTKFVQKRREEKRTAAERKQEEQQQLS